MKTVVLEVADSEANFAAFAEAWETGRAEPEARISFSSPELLWKVLSEKRWAILQILAGAGKISIRETAKRVGRDVKAVHGDVTALIQAGVLTRSQEGIEFPYDAVHVDFFLKAA